MNYAIIALLFAIAGFLLGFGDGGRGTYSRAVASIGGLIWLGGIIYAFYIQGLWFGLGAILMSFVIAALTMNLGKATVAGLRHK